jgi:hypothetical protein
MDRVRMGTRTKYDTLSNLKESEKGVALGFTQFKEMALVTDRGAMASFWLNMHRSLTNKWIRQQVPFQPSFISLITETVT